jgi:uncharacterized membrane protein
MSGVTNQEEDKKPTDQSAHINLKVKGQVSLILALIMTSRLLFFTRKKSSESLLGLLIYMMSYFVYNFLITKWIYFMGFN